MLAALRQTRILEEVRRAGGVRVADLVTILGVSDMTIRRDLEVLDRKGLVAKVHGGATAIETTSAVEPGFEAKSVREQNEKEAITARAAALVQPGMAIALTAGTTTWTLAHHLGDIPDLTVVTNSINVAQALGELPGARPTVVLTGGIRTPSDALVGPAAVQVIGTLQVDMVMMGVHGFDLRAGLTTPNLLEAETNRAFAAATRRLVVVADHTKWGTVGLARFAPLTSVTTLVTDDGLDPVACRALREVVGELVLVHPERHDEALDGTGG